MRGVRGWGRGSRVGRMGRLGLRRAVQKGGAARGAVGERRPRATIGGLAEAAEMREGSELVADAAAAATPAARAAAARSNGVIRRESVWIFSLTLDGTRDTLGLCRWVSFVGEQLRVGVARICRF